MTFGEGQQVLYERSHSDSSIAFDQFQRWLQSPRGWWPFRPAQFTFQQLPVVTPVLRQNSVWLVFSTTSSSCSPLVAVM
jgi:hypothetical protein